MYLVLETNLVRYRRSDLLAAELGQHELRLRTHPHR